MAESRAGAPLTLHPPAGPARGARLTPWERRGLVAFFALFVAFGGLVELRSALLSRRMGDLDCFLRAAWAVRSGADLYDVTDDNGFHYNYPPLLAVLAAPLADPPAGADSAGMLPFAVSTGIWYALNLLFLGLAVHWLAGALEGSGGALAVPRGSRAWWALRVWPVLGCLIPIGHTLMRSQTNLLVLALLGATLADVLRGRRFRGGLWLSGAMCLKIFPAFLLLFPLWRRDGRCLAGCALGLVLGLGVIPAAVLGPARTLHCYRRLTAVLVMPGLGAGTDESRADELTNANATDSQSFLVVIHNTRHPHFPTRPPRASTAERLASLALGGLMTLLTLLAAGWPRGTRSTDPLSVVLFLGLLVFDMVLLCPVCHLHYFSLAVPVVMCLLATRWEAQAGVGPGAGLLLLLACSTVANLLPHIPSLIALRDLGLAMYGTLPLWLAGVLVLWRRTRSRSRLPLVRPAGPQTAAA